MNTFDLFSLKGKNVLITGGRAMYGQGATLALADAGANIYVASHSVESAKDFCENLSREKGVKVQAVAFDQGDIESIEKMVEFVVEDAGSLDVFVHCSRIIPKGEGGVGWTEDECALEANVKVNSAASLYLLEMVGKQICILANLAPRKIRGIESKGMILMARQNDGKMRFITPQETLCNGAEIG